MRAGRSPGVRSGPKFSGWYVDAVNGLAGAVFARAAPEPRRECLHSLGGFRRTFLQGDQPFSVAFCSGGCSPRGLGGVVPLLRGLNALRNASAGLVVPSCELAVARVYGRGPSSRAGMLTLSTVWPEPGLREQPPSLCTGQEGDQGQTRFFLHTPLRRLSARRRGESAMLPSIGAEHGVSGELQAGNPSGRLCPVR
jgi:hypothetical protein